ncbi:MAG: heavy metal-binding domain-containing protein [Acidobacteria bacterium]|nr:heavy metal-binding domain-containing protein [Acidobacteriota bacterium]
MIVLNTDHVPGREVGEALGLVRGSTIRAKHLGKDLMAGLRTIFGGEVKEYTEMLVEARAESVRRMKAQAAELDADAIINVRFMTSQVMSGAAEMLAYGTAVKLKDKESFLGP